MKFQTCSCLRVNGAINQTFVSYSKHMFGLVKLSRNHMESPPSGGYARDFSKCVWQIWNLQQPEGGAMPAPYCQTMTRVPLKVGLPWRGTAIPIGTARRALREGRAALPMARWRGHR